MKINENPKGNLQFNAFLLIFIIAKVQVGVGILGFQRDIFKEAGHDAWISVLLAGIVTHIVAWVMIKTLMKYESSDLYGIHEDVYGKWLGRLFSSIYILYFVILSLVVLRTYVEVIQTWMFPKLPTWTLAIIILFLVVYGLMGGIRVVVGVCFFSFFLTIWMFLLSYFPYQYSDWEHLKPILNASISDLLKGTYKMALTVIGFEILYFIYPFVKDKKLVGRYTHIGLLVTTFIYVAVMIISTIFFGEGQIAKTIWPTLFLFKIIQIPFLERFEYVVVSVWMLMILPNLLLFTWAATRGMKRVFNWKQKHALYTFTAIIFIASTLITTRTQVDKLGDVVGNNSLYIIFIYPFLLFILVSLKSKWKKKRRRQN